MQLSQDKVLLLNGAIVFVVVLLAFRFLNSRRESQFRDDLWEEGAQKKGKASVDQIHRTIDYIALEGPEEVTEKVVRPKAKEKTAKTRVAPEPSPYKAPNFRGKAHEILGISADADRDTIHAAYKYWIKRYHPDRVQHLGPGYVKQANARAEQLNDAKAAMLKRFV